MLVSLRGRLPWPFSALLNVAMVYICRVDGLLVAPDRCLLLHLRRKAAAVCKAEQVC